MEITYYRVKNRLLFIYKYRTIKSMKIINNDQICVSSSKGNFIISRRCPHQGAFLEKAFLHDNVITCHWHGCKIFTDIVGEKV